MKKLRELYTNKKRVGSVVKNIAMNIMSNILSKGEKFEEKVSYNDEFDSKENSELSIENKGTFKILFKLDEIRNLLSKIFLGNIDEKNALKNAFGNFANFLSFKFEKSINTVYKNFEKVINEKGEILEKVSNVFGLKKDEKDGKGDNLTSKKFEKILDKSIKKLSKLISSSVSGGVSGFIKEKSEEIVDKRDKVLEKLEKFLKSIKNQGGGSFLNLFSEDGIIGKIFRRIFGKTGLGRILAIPGIGTSVGRIGIGALGRAIFSPAGLGALALAGEIYGFYKLKNMVEDANSDSFLGKIRDFVSDNLISSIDIMTGGMISGNKKFAKETFDKSFIGQTIERVKKFGENVGEKAKTFKVNITERIPALLKEFEKQGILTDTTQKAMLLGQLAHETAGFTKMVEGKYTAEGIWKKRGRILNKMGVTFNELKEAEKKGQEYLFEYMYGDKYRNSSLGNKEFGDAYKYRGRGFIQLTGRANYESASRDLGIDLVNNPDLIVNNPEVNAKVTAWFLKNRSPQAIKALQNHDIAGLTRAINGGLNGLEDRTIRTQQFMQALQNENTELSKAINSHSTSTLLAQATERSTQKLEKIQMSVFNPNNLEEKTLENSTQRNVVVVTQNKSKSPMPPTPQTSARTPSIPITPRNTETSLTRIAHGQMSYGVT